jgi:hypothetical protein
MRRHYFNVSFILLASLPPHLTLPLTTRPHTVDKYQGQQNDYVLLSLVRTSAVGHLRDVRRLVVALSRARLGIYVFCRQSLYESCYELYPAISQLVKGDGQSNGSRLELVGGEGFEGSDGGVVVRSGAESDPRAIPGWFAVQVPFFSTANQ